MVSSNLNPDNYLYVCSGYPSCDSYIGVHKKTMRPMGTLANGDLRHKRIEAHRALNKVVQAGIMTKHGAIYLAAEPPVPAGKGYAHRNVFRIPVRGNYPGMQCTYGTICKNEPNFFLREENNWQHEKWKKYPAYAGG